MTPIFYFFIQKEIELPMLWQFFNNFVYTVYTLWIIDELSIGPRGIKMFTNFPILLHPFALRFVLECFLFEIQIEQCSVREMKPFSIKYNLGFTAKNRLFISKKQCQKRLNCFITRACIWKTKSVTPPFYFIFQVLME